MKINFMRLWSRLPHQGMNQNDLSERLWSIAARVSKIVDAWPDTRLGRHVAGQLVRCGTDLQFHNS
jgi:hypothetical protein